MKTLSSGIMLGLIIILLAINPVAAHGYVNENEPNDTRQQSQNINNHCYVLGELGSGDTSDWYYVYQIRPGELTRIILSYNSIDRNIDVEVYSGDTLIEATSGIDSQKELLFTPTGTVYIRAVLSSGQGEYSFEFCQEDDWDDPTEAFQPGVWPSGGCG